MNNKEYRNAEITVDEENNLLVTGYACVFDKPTVLFSYEGVDYKEVINKNAFANADMRDVVLRYNHNDCNEILARTKNGTLRLVVDEYGLKMEAVLANTTFGNDIYELIRRGDIQNMSFAFTIADEAYCSITHTREILAFAKIMDVSVVDFPSYDDTWVTVKKQEIQEEEAKQRLYIASNV